MASGISSVNGKDFPQLSKEYANREKGGDRFPDLFLSGDMQAALTYEEYRDGIEIGIFDPEEAAKADGHCNYSGKSKLPLRRFIPNNEHDFRPGIKASALQITNEYLDEVNIGNEEESGELKVDLISRGSSFIIDSLFKKSK